MLAPTKIATPVKLSYVAANTKNPALFAICLRIFNYLQRRKQCTYVDIFVSQTLRMADYSYNPILYINIPIHMYMFVIYVSFIAVGP